MREDRRLVKLVRDDVEKFSGGDMVVRYEPMTDREFVQQLRKKLVEEATEYLLDPTDEELGDVLEVADHLAAFAHADGMRGVRRAQNAKRASKGGFLDKLGMYMHVAPEHR